ncbi:family 20 glycosylhydrolase [Telmatobacter sp. DSM 110680]|uniref:Family 20 glycosylhydrolase n=1 Tax=Telmatobacter sp. DSM 110680 TaxID=3036704 RepID=A0AAU7DR37_9BACT
MPVPLHVSRGEGVLKIDSNFTIALDGFKDSRLEPARKRFIGTLSRETGIPYHDEGTKSEAVLTVKTGGVSDAVQQLGENESYHLEVTPTHALLTAPNALGVMHGLQTFLQLVTITPEGFSVPVVTIDDEPRFPWRGLMIDVARHFQPIDVIERNLDGMEAVKMNVFHWHLSENQGFRAESKIYPLLTGKGSDGAYYTQSQMREIVEYARNRGIRVVPEFDMPCHTTAWFVGYPELASGKGPYKIERKWGIMDPAMDPTRESTFEFIGKFIGEMTTIFPDAYFHVGGDECNGKEWDANPRIKEFMRAHGLKDNAALQSYFTARVQKLVAAHHRIMEGWDEVLAPNTPKDVVIQSWRGPKSLAAAAKQGNRGLLSTGYYVDLNESAAQHYLADPLAGDGANLTPEEKKRVLGGEAAMWSEFTTSEIIDSRIWPRTAAIAERLWSAQDVRDVDSMYARMAVVSDKLESYGLTHQSFTRPMLQRMSGDADTKYLAVLASVVQPPMGYQREELKEYDWYSPLNHLVDAVPPESETARKFKNVVAAIVAGNASPEHYQEAKEWLTLWHENDAKLAPSLKRSDITAELAPLSQSLSQVSAIGLRALDDLQNHRAANASITQSDTQTLKAAEKPQAVLRNMVVAPVEMLVQAAGAQR